MGLLDLQTDLTSLKYGAKLPAVRHKMGNKVSQASARIDDVKRLGVILTQAPGLKFAANQTLLQNAKIGSAIASKDKLGGAILAGLGAAFKATVGSGIFLTANAGRAGTGFHGINPSVASSYLTSTVPSQPGEESVRPGSEGADKESFLTRVINTVTTIATAVGAQSSNYHAAQEILGGAQFVSKTYKDPLYLSIGKDQGTSEIYVDNSGGVKKAIRRTDLYNKLEVGQVDNEKRYLNSDDLKDKRLDKYYQSEGGEGDRIQQYGKDLDEIKKALGADEQDIIPFIFNFYTPGEDSDRFIYFRAFLDSLSDSYQANWSGIKYVGRAEEFFTYTGFGRTMSFAFKAAAFSRKDLEPIYYKLNKLVGGTAPTYGEGGLFMRGTLLKLTIGDYIKEQNGFLSSVSLTWNTDYPWELEGNLKVPHMLDVSCEFTPIHTFNPEFGVDEKLFIGA